MANQKLNLIINGKNNAGPAVSSLKSGILGLNAATLGLTVGIGGLVAGIAKAVSAANVQELAEAKLAATLKSTKEVAGLTFDELTKMAAGLQKVTTFGDEATIATQSLLLTFTKIGKDVFPDALKIIQDISVGMGQDMKSSAIQVGKALNDPILGITAMSRVGIAFSDVQKQQIKDFVKLGEVAKAQRVILDELNTQFGGQAQAQAETFGGKLSQLTNNFGDLLEAIGRLLTQSPILIDILTSLSQAFAFLATTIGKDYQKEFAEFQQSLNEAAKKASGVESEWKAATFKMGNSVVNLRKITKKEFDFIVANAKFTSEEQKKAFIKSWEEANRVRKELTNEQIQAEIDRLEKEIAILKEREALSDAEIKRIEEIEKKRTALTEERLRQAESTITFEEALRKGSADKEEESLEERIKKRREAHEKMNADALTLFDALEEDMRTRAEFTAAVVASSLDAIGDAFSVFFTVMFTRNKDFAEQMKDVWRGLVNTILKMIGQLIARMIALQVLTSLFPGGAIVGTGFKQIFGRSLMGMFGIQGFQTPHGSDRVIPGPPNMPVPFIGHGGETVGRGGGGGMTLIVQGDFLSTEETQAKLFELGHDYKKRNNLEG